MSQNLIQHLLKNPQIEALQHAFHAQQVLEQAIAIQQIAAPTFAEAQRATYIHQQFAALGLEAVETGDLDNVYGWHRGTNPQLPPLMISAHTDTVFPIETDLSIRHSENRIYGAGLGDNSLGVAALLTVARLYSEFKLPHQADICFVANSREEGLGNLGGIKAAITHLDHQIGAALVLEGTALGQIHHGGIAVKRFKIAAQAEGGHSWLNFGRPSAIHHLMRLGAEISHLQVPTDPRSSYNIGLVEGGNSINSIASEAAFYLDLRSEEPAYLETLVQTVQGLVDRHLTEEVNFTMTLIGERPSGAIPSTHPLVELAQKACQAVNIQPNLTRGSTDANALLAVQIPTVCIGIGYGANAHTLEEYITTTNLEDGVWHLLLLSLAVANSLSTW